MIASELLLKRKERSIITLAFKVSKMVSTMRMSTPPSRRPLA